MKEIEVKIKNGILKAVVDDEDYEYLSQFKWYGRKSSHDKTHYAFRNSSRKVGRKSIYMHREILQVTDSKVMVDHIDHNGLHNQRCNIRIASCAQNQWNQQAHIGKSIKGVRWHNRDKVWESYIHVGGKQTYLGRFSTEHEARTAYNEASERLHGEFGCTNNAG